MIIYRVAALILILVLFASVAFASRGDNNDFFRECQYKCQRSNCTKGAINFQTKSKLLQKQSVFDKLFGWTCGEECRDECMWRTVKAFQERKWGVPQFYGKWPFVRIFGLQEPASVIFSIMNFLAHFHQMRKFQSAVRKDSPCYRLWHIFAFVCLNGWFWSTIFHARDTNLTEFFDYVFAYSIVLATLYCMVMRFLFDKSLLLRGLVTVVFCSYYFNYFMYLYVGQFDYSFNMKANIITGALSAVGWIIWSLIVWKRRPYAKKMVLFYLYLGPAFILEYLDFSPFLWTFDAHSLWHLSSVPLAFIIYSFAIDDCQHLRKEKMVLEHEDKIL